MNRRVQEKIRTLCNAEMTMMTYPQIGFLHDIKQHRWCRCLESKSMKGTRKYKNALFEAVKLSDEISVCASLIKAVRKRIEHVEERFHIQNQKLIPQKEVKLFMFGVSLCWFCVSIRCPESIQSRNLNFVRCLWRVKIPFFMIKIFWRTGKLMGKSKTNSMFSWLGMILESSPGSMTYHMFLFCHRSTLVTVILVLIWRWGILDATKKWKQGIQNLFCLSLMTY